MVRPLHRAAGDRPRAVHRDRAAARLAAVSAGRSGGSARAARRGRRGTVAVATLTDALDHPPALVLFAFAFFALAALRRSSGAARRPARAGRRRGWRRSVTSSRATGAAGGGTVHAGSRWLSSRSRLIELQTSEDVRLKPGDSAEVGDYTVTYDRPTSRSTPRSRSSRFGAVLAVERDVGAFARSPARGYYSSSSGDATIAGFFEGEATSEVGRDTELGRPVDGDAPRSRAARTASPSDRRRAASGSARTLPTPGLAAQVEAMVVRTDRQGQVIHQHRWTLSPPAAGRLPRQREPVRDLDLDRRRDRRRRRADRRLAGTRGAGARAGRLRGRLARDLGRVRFLSCQGAGVESSSSSDRTLCSRCVSCYAVLAAFVAGRARRSPSPRRGRDAGLRRPRGPQGGALPPDPRRRARSRRADASGLTGSNSTPSCAARRSRC